VAGAFALPLLAGAVHPALWPAELRRLTAAVLGILGAVWAGHGQAAAAVAVAAPLIAGWRGRDWATAAGALLPAAPAAFHWPGWSAMAGAFALVGAGLAASRRRLRAEPVPMPAAEVPEPTPG
jgi:hypothetical protein